MQQQHLGACLPGQTNCRLLSVILKSVVSVGSSKTDSPFEVSLPFHLSIETQKSHNAWENCKPAHETHPPGHFTSSDWLQGDWEPLSQYGSYWNKLIRAICGHFPNF